MNGRKLLDDCFLHDTQRMRHDDVLALLAKRLRQTVGNETVMLNDAIGRTCDQDTASAIAVPRSDNAAVDGYAFAHHDYHLQDGKLRIAGTTSAGMPAQTLEGSTAGRIYTGAIMPKGADSVAMQEDCKRDGDFVQIPAGIKLGANCRLRGEDVQQGTFIAKAGHVLGPAHIAAFASVGMASLTVRKKLRVGILSTGDEIVQPGTRAEPHQVYDANRPMLAALLANPSVDVTDLGHLPDNLEVLSKAAAAAASSLDMIITTGGASRGGEDHMLDVLDRLGKCHVWQIAVKPGRPMMFGQIGDCVLLGLPGNPVAAFVCTLLYVRPTMALLMGIAHRQPRAFMLPAGFAVPNKKKDRREFARAWRDENGVAQKFTRDGSGLISGLVAAGGLIDLPEETSSVAKGDLVRFIPLSEFDIAHKDQP
ncbi:MAG: gephyrin-like molybdotransferase Glp [Pseudomonadota bacterium]